MKSCVFILTIITLTAQAQNGLNALGPQTFELGNVLARGYTTDYENTPYIPQSIWLSGYVKAKGGKTYKVDSLRFDTFQNLVEYRYLGKTYTPAFDVVEFGFNDGRVYANNFTPFDDLTEQTFLQVFYDKKNYLVLHKRCSILDITPYNSASKLKQFDFNDYYYLLKPDGKFTRSRRLNESLLEGLKDHESAVKSFTKSKKLNLKTPEGWKQLLAYYDSL